MITQSSVASEGISKLFKFTSTIPFYNTIRKLYKFISHIICKMTISEVLPKKVDFSKYVGEWVVVCENKVVAHDKNLNNVKKEIKECKRIPTITKIPKKDTLIF